ncbi:TonB-dependent receptor domain-containing protein [Saccharicrinis sp. 156]|uniref:TonB-dependent receptor domain-containing protein n=1 Tax=Saccharicrinis sp. 156 TaxID=3417574 RepID=UPI003D337334
MMLNSWISNLTLLILLIINNSISAQIQGSVRDFDNRPLSFANVILINQSDSSVVSGLMATDEGFYSITSFKPGKYIIEVSMLGYKKGYSTPFEIRSSKDHHHNKPILLGEMPHEIDGVKVVAEKPIYELKIDRMVVNVESSISSSGSTALEVLEKSPGVIVDRQNEELSLAGKSGVMVMINGKRSRMPIAAAVQMLDAMNADNVERIELITTPPAKYDAEGDAGIINIVLKKSEDLGTNGSFTLGAGVAHRERMNASLDINHHVDKVNYFGSYNANFQNRRTEINSYRKLMVDGSELETYTDMNWEAIRTYHNIRMGFDYTISSKTILSMLGSGYVRDWDDDGVNAIQYYTDQNLTNESDLNQKKVGKWIHGMGNINLQHHFNEEVILDVNIDYLNYYHDDPADYTLENLGLNNVVESTEEFRVTKETPIDILVGAVDFSTSVNEKLSLEAGFKETMTWFSNDVSLTYFDNAMWTVDEELTNMFNMKEDISAVYLSAKFNPNKKTSLSAGLRYEYMNTTLDSETEKGIIDMHYGELFPTFYASHGFNDDNTIQFSYSRRISRPTFNQLAPFIAFVTPDTYVSGNEDLLPAFSDNLKVDYRYKSWILSYSYTETKDAITRFQPKQSEDETKQYFVSRNLDQVKTQNVMLGFPVNVNSWWKMRYNFTWVHNRTITDYEDTKIDYKQGSYMFNGTQNFIISKKISSEISGFYTSKSNWGVYTAKARGRVDIGVQMKLKNENSQLSINLTDAFKTNVFGSETEIPDLNIHARWRLDFEPRVLRIKFTHKFGNQAVKARKRKTASDEEQRRVTAE